jgi:hypothetical protein
MDIRRAKRDIFKKSKLSIIKIMDKSKKDVDGRDLFMN